MSFTDAGLVTSSFFWRIKVSTGSRSDWAMGVSVGEFMILPIRLRRTITRSHPLIAQFPGNADAGRTAVEAFSNAFEADNLHLGACQLPPTRGCKGADWSPEKPLLFGTNHVKYALRSRSKRAIDSPRGGAINLEI